MLSDAWPCRPSALRCNQPSTLQFPPFGATPLLDKPHGQKQPCLLLRRLHGRQQRNGQAEVLVGAAADHHLLEGLGLQRRLGAAQLPAAGVQIILNAGCCIRSPGAV